MRGKSDSLLRTGGNYLIDWGLEGAQMIWFDSVSHKLLVGALARVLPMVGALVVTAGVACAADPPSSPPAANEAPTDEVIVEGKHEGPRMWRVAKGDHVLWVLGTISPLPRKMTWQSESVETVLQETQEVLPAWPSIGVGANPFTAGPGPACPGISKRGGRLYRRRRPGTIAHRPEPPLFRCHIKARSQQRQHHLSHLHE